MNAVAGGGWLYLEIGLGSGGAESRGEGEAPLKLVGSGVDKMFTFWRLDVSPLAPQPAQGGVAWETEGPGTTFETKIWERSTKLPARARVENSLFQDKWLECQRQDEQDYSTFCLCQWPAGSGNSLSRQKMLVKLL